jgi:hypothetical protein
MKTVQFVLDGEKIVNVVNNTDMSDEFVNRLISTFIDLGWIITEKSTVGYFEMKDNDTVHIVFQLTENDGNIEPYELEEDSFSHLLTDDEPEQVPQKIGYRGMSNVSQA